MSSTGAAARPAPVHVPVLLERVTELLAPACAADGAVLVDATLGLAGHSLAMLDAHPGLRLIGLDRDPDARAEAARRIEAAGHTDRVTLVPAVFDELPDVLARLGIAEVQGVLFDLGRLLAAARPARPRLQLLRRRPAGHADGPGRPAHRRRRRQHLPAEGPRPRAAGLRRGAVRLADRRARSTASAPGSRSRTPPGWPSWSATRSPPPPAAPAATRPSARSRRCASRSTTSSAPWSGRCRPRVEALAVGGRVVVITFHSLEDRIVKQTLAAGAVDRTPPELAGAGAGARPGPAAADPRRRGRRPRPRSRRTRGPRPPASGPPSASGGQHEQPRDRPHAARPAPGRADRRDAADARAPHAAAPPRARPAPRAAAGPGRRRARPRRQVASAPAAPPRAVRAARRRPAGRHDARACWSSTPRSPSTRSRPPSCGRRTPSAPRRCSASSGRSSAAARPAEIAARRRRPPASCPAGPAAYLVIEPDGSVGRCAAPRRRAGRRAAATPRTGTERCRTRSGPGAGPADRRPPAGPPRPPAGARPGAFTSRRTPGSRRSGAGLSMDQRGLRNRGAWPS